MWLGSQSEETLLCIREQSRSRGASQSAVSCRWLSLCTLWPSYLQWPSEQISFITRMCLAILQLSFRHFWQSTTSPRSVSPPLQPRFGSLRLLAFPKVKIAFEREEICECDCHTVHKLNQQRLTADWLDPRESDCIRMQRKRSPLTGCLFTSRSRDRFSRYSK